MRPLRRAKDEQRRTAAVERARRVLVALTLAVGAAWIGMNALVGAYTGVYRAVWMLATGDISAITFGERRTPDDQLQTTPPWDSPPPLPMITPPPPPGEAEGWTVE